MPSGLPERISSTRTAKKGSSPSRSHQLRQLNQVITMGVVLNVGMVLDWSMLEAQLQSVGARILVAGRS